MSNSDISVDLVQSGKFGPLSNGEKLLKAMKAQSLASFAESPSPDVIAFIQRIETADPNSDVFDEDNLGSSWGHSQFTSGSITCKSVVDSWSSIGNIATACRLIAAVIKTCNVARHLCHIDGSSPSSWPFAWAPWT